MPTKIGPNEMLVSTRVSRTFHKEVKKAAAADNRSLQAYVKVAIEEKMQRDMQRASNVAWMPPGVGIMQGR
jgi:hypothetical protein